MKLANSTVILILAISTLLIFCYTNYFLAKIEIRYSLTPTKYHLFTNEFLQEKGIYTKKLHHQGVQKLLSKKLQRSGFMSFKKFTGVQKGRKLGLDRLLLNFETFMWIFEWQVIKYEISRRKIRFFHILCKIFKNA